MNTDITTWLAGPMVVGLFLMDYMIEFIDRFSWLILAIIIVAPIFLILAGVWIGILMFPYILHQRASRTDSPRFDKSNRANTFAWIAHYGTHPEDFELMEYPNGKKPFDYLSEDLLSDTLNSRPDPGELY